MPEELERSVGGYLKAKDAELSYDCEGFHPACTGCTPVWVGYPAIWCPSCKVLMHLDLAGEHVQGGSDIATH